MLMSNSSESSSRQSVMLEIYAVLLDSHHASPMCTNIAHRAGRRAPPRRPTVQTRMTRVESIVDRITSRKMLSLVSSGGVTLLSAQGSSRVGTDRRVLLVVRQFVLVHTETFDGK